MASTDWNKIKVSEIAPHELLVRKFAETRSSELQSLHSIVSNRLNNDFRSQRNKRRRTTSHDDRIARKRSRNKNSNGFSDVVKEEKGKKVSRRVRRSIELKKNPVSGFCVSGDGTKRLRTHVWLAKRFSMTKCWGFYLPLGVNGRGRGSRALLKKLKTGVLVHDASYYSAVQLQGPQELVLMVLASVLMPSPSVDSEKQLLDILSGDVFGSAMLHRAEEQFSRPIAPVTYMWRPLQQIFSNAECSSNSLISDSTTVRQVWVWIHAAAFTEAYDALSSACKSQLDVAGGPVECTSLEGQLAKLELIGSQSVQLLKKTLIPGSKFAKSERDDLEDQVETSIFKNNNQTSNSEVITLTVMDPRASTKEGSVIVSEENNNCYLREYKTKSDTVSSLSNNGMQHIAGCSSLWDVSKGICTPMHENDICMEKHQKREEFFRIGRKSSRTQDTSVEGKNCRWCPILMLKNKTPDEIIIRCSVILPLCWAKIFWNAFMLNGAHAIGLREKQWIASEMGLTCFPLDFPDCNAYTHTMAMEKVVLDQKASLLPPSKKPPLEVPIPPPWHCVKLHYEKRPEKSHSLVEECSLNDEILDELMKKSDSVKSDTERLDSLSVSFEGHIARTSSVLSEFLKSGNQLYLFPRIPDQSSCMDKVMKQEEFPTDIISEAEHNKEKCFVRVLLHAYRKGVFEQGAVVCAPNAADITLLTRSEDENQLQLPESALKSYFVCLPSGEWELKVPEDSALRESFRLPVGFITTGFVRGSKRAVAGACCEATLLSRLRMEQWRESSVKKRKKEIYVLVRNMRSTAYRLALASIVLEQKDDDVEFM